LDEYWEGPEKESKAPLPVRWMAWNGLQRVVNKACAAIGKAAQDPAAESRFQLLLSNELRLAIVDAVRTPSGYLMVLDPPASPRKDVVPASKAIEDAVACVQGARGLTVALRRALALLHVAVVSAHGRLIAKDQREFLPHHSLDCRRLASAADELLTSPGVAWYADTLPKQNRRRVMYEELKECAQAWRMTADAIESNPPAKHRGQPPLPGTTYDDARKYLRRVRVPDRIAQDFLGLVRP
jgi:hypothetical protein